MKKIKLALVIVLGVLSAGAARAQYSDLYSCPEFSLDAFGFYGSRDKDGNASGKLGPGVGVNYFFNDYIGVGGDTYADAFHWPYLLNGFGIFRYPIHDTAVAPYGFGGFGREWTHAPQWLGHIGVGAEYRFRRNLGAFADVREVFPFETKEYTVVRFGIRFRFH